MCLLLRLIRCAFGKRRRIIASVQNTTWKGRRAPPPSSTSPNVDEEYEKVMRARFLHRRSHGDDHVAEVLLRHVPSPRLRCLLLKFFHVALEASLALTSLLDDLRISRRHHFSLLSALHQDVDLTLRHLDLPDPFSGLGTFNDVHRHYRSLASRLSLHRARVAGRLRLIHCLHSASLWGLVVSSGALTRVAGMIRQADAAARGAYVVSRELDTISRMMERLCGEVEHGRYVVGLYLRKGRDLHVMREMEVEEKAVMEQLEEMEEHVYWCLKTIERTRGFVVEELRSGPRLSPPSGW